MKLLDSKAIWVDFDPDYQQYTVMVYTRDRGLVGHCFNTEEELRSFTIGQLMEEIESTPVCKSNARIGGR